MEADIVSNIGVFFPLKKKTQETSPNFIYVSELLRTWETAVLLFLNGINNELTLFISPFLREKGIFTSDNPGVLKEQFREFIRFISFLRFLKKENINGISILIPNNFTIFLKHFIGSFPVDFIDGIEKPEGVDFGIVLSMNDDQGDQDAHNGCIFIQFEGSDQSSGNEDFTNHMIGNVVGTIKENLQHHKSLQQHESLNYVPYSSDTPYDLSFPPPSTEKAIGDMTTPSIPEGSLADFLDWYKSLDQKPHSSTAGDASSDNVFLVSHSGTLDIFIQRVISDSDTKPSEDFLREYTKAMETNIFSVVFRTHDIPAIFNVFRHAYSCDNRYKNKGLSSIFQRVKAGGYTNLALWGILSTMLFSKDVINKLVNETIQIGNDKDNTEPVLKICRGVDYEPDHLHTANYDSVNLLCGEQRNRMETKNFKLVFGHCGTSSVFTRTLDENCIRITMTPTLGSKSKVVLFLDKTKNPKNPKNQIEARFFLNVEKSITYVNKIVLEPTRLDHNLSSIIENIMNPQNRPESLDEYIKELKHEITSFINSNKDDPKWDGIAWQVAWYTLLDKVLPNQDDWVVLNGDDSLASSSASGRSFFPQAYIPADIPPGILAFGGTIKKTRRHRHKKYKVMKKYTQKNKKYKPKPTKKFKRNQKHKKTHKYRSRKYRK
jgi:hypothetical protein